MTGGLLSFKRLVRLSEINESAASKSIKNLSSAWEFRWNYVFMLTTCVILQSYSPLKALLVCANHLPAAVCIVYYSLSKICFYCCFCLRKKNAEKPKYFTFKYIYLFAFIFRVFTPSFSPVSNQIYSNT